MSATRKRPRTADGAQDLPEVVRGAHDATLETRLRDAFGEMDGYALAATATAKRRANGEHVTGLTYGEIDAFAFAELLRGPVALRPGERFVDLGCGSGKALCVAAYCGAGTAVGVECVQALAEAAARATKRFDADGVTVVCGDMFEVDWTDADVVFVSTTCLDDDTLERLSGSLNDLTSPGARVITTTRPLPSAAEATWTLAHKGRYKYGKGIMTFHMYSRHH